MVRLSPDRDNHQHWIVGEDGVWRDPFSGAIRIVRTGDGGMAFEMDEATWRKVSAAAQTIDGARLDYGPFVRAVGLTRGAWKAEPGSWSAEVAKG